MNGSTDSATAGRLGWEGHHAHALAASPLRRIMHLADRSRLEIAGRLAFFGMIAGVCLIGAVCLASALAWVDRPFAGFLINPRMVVSTVGQYHWTGREAGVRNPDRVLGVNGRTISSVREFDELVPTIQVGTSVRYTVLRDRQVLEVDVPTMRFTPLDLLMVFGIPFVSGLAYLLIAAVVYLLKPDTRASFAFLTACFFLSVYTVVAFDVFATHKGFIRLYLVADAFLPAAFLHLSLVFPETRRVVQRRPWVQVLPYVVSTIILIPLEVFYQHPWYLFFSRLTRFYAIVAALIMLGFTLHACFGTVSILARQRAKVVLFGAAFAFPITAIARFSAVVGGVFLGVPIQTNLLAVPLVLFPASIAYAIAKHNLFDVDVYIKRAIGWGIMTAVVGLAYTSVQTVLSTFVLGPLVGDARETVYPLVFAILVVFLFNPINRRVQEGVDRVFYRKQLDYKRTISAVSNVLTSMLNLDQIITQVIHTIRSAMFVDAAGVIVLQPEKKACQTFFLGDYPLRAAGDGREVIVGYDDPLLALIREEKTLVTKYDLEEDPRYADVRDVCLQRFSAMAATLAIPLVYQETVTGVLALGQKKSGHFYSRDDIDLLSTMADQAAVAIENATTHEEVVRYAEELAASLRRIQLLESIKSNLAKFVPRTVQELIEESPEAPSLEKREIDCSVLFADITGYTRLSAQMELDQVNKLVERYFGAFLDEILRRGGDVNETAGDGLMVIFRKKDPRRHARAAVLAALGIQRRTREINAELAGQSEPIVMKVGVNSGIASVGTTRIEGVAGTRWTYTASGPTTNVAARLAALAEGAGGGVIISEETRRRVGDEFQVEDLGPQTLKNVPEPVRAFRAVGREGVGAVPSDSREAGRRARRLYIVSRDHPDLYDELRRRHQGVPDVEVIQDRRVGERRQRVVEGLPEEHRRADRRSRPDVDAELRSSAHVVRDVEAQPDVPRPEASPP